MATAITSRQVQGTNLTVACLPSSPNPLLERLRGIVPDDTVERDWILRLRPRSCLIHAAESFSHGISQLRPAAHFCTFDSERAHLRREARRERHQSVTEGRRKSRMVAPLGLKKALDPKKLPRITPDPHGEEAAWVEGNDAAVARMMHTPRALFAQQERDAVKKGQKRRRAAETSDDVPDADDDTAEPRRPLRRATVSA